MNTAGRPDVTPPVARPDVTPLVARPDVTPPVATDTSPISKTDVDKALSRYLDFVLKFGEEKISKLEADARELEESKKIHEDQVIPAKCEILGNYSNWRIQELGLGRGVDGTAQSAGNRISSYQIREVKDDKTNLICLDEGGSLTSFVREVNSIQEQQFKLDGSLTSPTPSVPVTVDMGVEVSRGKSVNRKSIGKRIVTKTIAFKPSFGEREEAKLARDILLHANIPYDHTSGKSSVEILLEESQLHLDEFVEQYRLTHYISSITLGASTFIVLSDYELKKQASVKGKVGYQAIAHAGISASFVSKLIKKNENVHNVGKLSPDEESIEAEAVVEINLMPISSLIQTREFREKFQAAVAKLIKKQDRGQNGPFKISCNDGKLLLKAVPSSDGSYVAVHTTTKIEEASLFYVYHTDDEIHPNEFQIVWKGDMPLQESEEGSTLPMKVKRETATVRYLMAPVSTFGRNYGPLRLESKGYLSDGLFSLNNALTKSFFEGTENVSTTKWLDGSESYLIRCTRRRWAFDGFVAVRKVQSLNSTARQSRHVHVTCCERSSQRRDNGNVFMSFRLLTKSLWSDMTLADHHAATGFSINE